MTADLQQNILHIVVLLGCARTLAEWCQHATHNHRLAGGASVHACCCSDTVELMKRCRQDHVPEQERLACQKTAGTRRSPSWVNSRCVSSQKKKKKKKKKIITHRSITLMLGCLFARLDLKQWTGSFSSCDLHNKRHVSETWASRSKMQVVLSVLSCTINMTWRQ